MLRTLTLSLVALTACAKTSTPGSDGDAPTPPAKPTDRDSPEPELPAPLPRDDRAAVAEALRPHGVTLDDSDCIAWPPSFPRVVVIGSFANDRGCQHSGTLVDRQWSTDEASVAGLATRGFASASLDDKHTIARAWVDEVNHAFGHDFVTASEPAFSQPGSPAFTPVHVRDDKLAGVVIEGWVRLPSGMVDETAYAFEKHRITRDGAHSHESDRRFAVDGAVLRGETTKP
ncbi:MAG: hypothetical protein IPH07_34535 [Deltaproteobacteria bacterium]|nr:hypothetical protein [Deltaproteobacteria bacterium]MBK8716383.1 hypothetical protein [Deltaproteobacteria bacterium]MBP7287896.1 hypothetical protein [Nannocystaceae bacterium]